MKKRVFLASLFVVDTDGEADQHAAEEKEKTVDADGEADQHAAIVPPEVRKGGEEKKKPQSDKKTARDAPFSPSPAPPTGNEKPHEQGAVGDWFFFWILFAWIWRWRLRRLSTS